MKRLVIVATIAALLIGIVGCVETSFFEIDPNSGVVLKTVVVTSQDELLTVTVPEGTVALDKDDNPLLALSVDIDPEPPTPPEDAHIIGLAYDLGPDGATFDPPMTLTLKYIPEFIPEGVKEEDLVIAYYDEALSKWVILESEVDTAANTIEASASHLTTFAIVGVPPVQYNLSVSSTAGGNVTVPGEGVFSYDEGTIVSLDATPDVGYQFINWTGNAGTIADVNTAPTTINMTGNYSITANFEEIPTIQYDLTISSTAGGSVTVPGEGTFAYNASTVVSLVATPLGGYYFQDWTGNVSTVASTDGASTTIAMNDTYSIVANFDQIPVTYHTLTMAASGNGSTSPSVGQHTYAAGTLVPMVATPAAGYCFVNWTGNTGTVGNVNTASTTVRMNGNYSITANFAEGEAVYFPDPNLEAAIREAIDKPTGTIYSCDLQRLTRLNGNNKNIADLTGLEYCTSLGIVDLALNQIADISPLANLTNLTALTLDYNQISDISPLANLTGLTHHLGLGSNQISDISPLANLTNLRQIQLDHNQISAIFALANLTGLRLASLDYNHIGDISPLVNLTNLVTIRVRNNQISDISPLANLTDLGYVDLDYNQIADINPLVQNEGVGTGDTVKLQGNPLSSDSINIYIPQLEARGVQVVY